MRNVFICPQNYQPMSSNHFIISFSVKLNIDHNTIKNPSSYLQFPKSNYPILINFVLSVNSYQTQTLSGSLLRISLQMEWTIFPRIRFISSSFSKWCTSNIYYQIKCLWTLRKNKKSHSTNHKFNGISTYRNYSYTCRNNSCTGRNYSYTLRYV